MTGFITALVCKNHFIIGGPLCPVCEKDAQIASLEAKVEGLEKALVSCPDHHGADFEIERLQRRVERANEMSESRTGMTPIETGFKNLCDAIKTKDAQIASLEAKVKELEEEKALAYSQYQITVKTALNERANLVRKVERAKEALDKYGRHFGECKIDQSYHWITNQEAGTCTCGFTIALAELSGGEK